jgi:LysM repeat protein
MLPAMIGLHPPRPPARFRSATVVLLAGCLLAGCALDGTPGTTGTVSGDQAPPGGMVPGAVGPLSSAATPIATATSAPIVAVATIVRPSASPVPATPVPATPLPATPTVPPVPTAVPPPPLIATELPTPEPKPKATAVERPTGTARPTASPSPRATAAAAGTIAVTPAGTPHVVSYTVQRGDDVYAIARRFGVTTAAIARANDLKDPSQIKAGQVLHIPIVGTGGETPIS